MASAKLPDTRHPTPDTLLVCAATRFELETFRRDGETWNETDEIAYRTGEFACVISGVGIPETFAILPKAVQILAPARILNIGIAGAYPGNGLAIGDIVAGESECYGDIGFELPDERNFQPIAESDFGAFYRNKLPLALLGNSPAEFALKTGGGCTVNACAGTQRTGELRARLFHADFETMEGAAVAQIGAARNIPVCEIRAVSNFAADRDMRPENIRLALTNLRRFLLAFRLSS